MRIVLADQHHRHPTAERMPGYGRRYPEVPARLDRILAGLAAAGFPAPVPPADFGPEPLLAVHSEPLLDHLRTAWGRSRSGCGPDEPFLPDTFANLPNARHHGDCLPARAGVNAFDVSCPIFEGTWAASYSATQAALTAADHVRQHGGAAYSLGRPPGHHAGRRFHGGFCYTNHTAAAAAYLAGFGRVAVLDIDYHHGNGTQDVFTEDRFQPSDRVFVASLHADPRADYPYFWGHADESDEFNRNVPLPHGTTDDGYLAALDPVLREISDYGPRFLVLAAGFDLMAGDPVPRNGGFAVTPPGLARIAGRIASLKLPTVIVQEGGYNLDRLGEYAVTLLAAFA
jgi:acetoin utilization deacetylase AcuC-like enzyme